MCVWVAGSRYGDDREEKSSNKSKLLRCNHIYAILDMFSGKLSNCWHSNLFSRVHLGSGKAMVRTEDMEQCRRIPKETKSLEKVRLFLVHCKGT